MDEDHSKIEDFSTIIKGGKIGDYSDLEWDQNKKKEDLDCFERSTMVFWNVKQCPIPSSAIPCVEPELSSALHRMGLHGMVQLFAFGDTFDQKEDFSKARIYYRAECEHLLPDAIDKGYSEMAVDLISFARMTYDCPAILMVIPKPDPDSELHRVLKCLEARNHDVLLVEPGDDDIGRLFASVQSIVDCTQDDDVKKPATGVFWDAVGCPFPPGMSPDEIHQKIEIAICDGREDSEWTAETSIWVYVDETQGPWVGDFLKNKT
ncbi:unnamed protein product [Microthlaspi erraticum]|uniref:NYN domain-containing protein n=1 Tax=Microthlaspi erraticum TaxID=1685480 RepID=A0A6D2J9M2_9BRAS|nr:unnamed protein product [Microthlaspi erraticum]